jgi:hypothetical protein
MKPIPRWFTAVCWVMAINFSLWTGLQANDSDPTRWMLIYGGAALVSAALPARLFAAAVAGVIGAIAIAWGVYLAHQVWGVLSLDQLRGGMSAKDTPAAVAREAGGLIIVAVWMLGAALYRFIRA